MAWGERSQWSKSESVTRARLDLPWLLVAMTHKRHYRTLEDLLHFEVLLTGRPSDGLIQPWPNTPFPPRTPTTTAKKNPTNPFTVHSPRRVLTPDSISMIESWRTMIITKNNLLYKPFDRSSLTRTRLDLNHETHLKFARNRLKSQVESEFELFDLFKEVSGKFGDGTEIPLKQGGQSILFIIDFWAGWTNRKQNKHTQSVSCSRLIVFALQGTKSK